MDESLKAQLQATLDMIPAFHVACGAIGALLFVNSRCADYLACQRIIRFDSEPSLTPRGTLISPFCIRRSRRNARVGSDNLRTGGTT